MVNHFLKTINKHEKDRTPGIDLLINICKHPQRYRNVIGVLSHADAVRALIEMGEKVPAQYMPKGMRDTIYDWDTLTIGTIAVRELNMN